MCSGARYRMPLPRHFHPMLSVFKGRGGGIEPPGQTLSQHQICKVCPACGKVRENFPWKGV